MNDDILKMAREACDQAPREDWNSTAWVFGDEGLARFAALVRAAEQDRCCRIIYGMAGSDNVAQRTVEKIRGKE